MRAHASRERKWEKSSLLILEAILEHITLARVTIIDDARLA